MTDDPSGSGGFTEFHLPGDMLLRGQKSNCLVLGAVTSIKQSGVDRQQALFICDPDHKPDVRECNAVTARCWAVSWRSL